MICGLEIFLDFSCHHGCCACHRSLCIQHRLLCFLGNSSSSEICSLLPSKTCFGGATTADFKVVCNHCQEHCAAISLGLSAAPLIIFLLLLMQSFLCLLIRGSLACCDQSNYIHFNCNWNSEVTNNIY